MESLAVLEELGLTEAECRVYLALLELGSSRAGPIIKKTNLHRGTTYQILQRLEEKGLVSSIIEGKKQKFDAADPQRLMDLLKEKEENLHSILPELALKRKMSKETQDVTVYYGIKGIRSILDKILEELSSGGEYCDFGVSGKFRDVMGPYWDLFQKRKRTLSIKSRVLFNENVKKNYPGLLKDYVGKARFIESGSITDTIIYSNTVVLLIWTSTPVVGIVIENKDNANSYRSNFELLWKHAHP